MWAVGFSILEHSKRHMYQVYYDVLQPHFRKKMMALGRDDMGIEVCMSDTDSFLVKVYSEDLREDYKALEPHFDFSNYPKTHPLFNEDKKNAVG